MMLPCTGMSSGQLVTSVDLEGVSVRDQTTFLSVNA